MTPIRIGNVEYLEAASIDGSKTYEEIVLWYENSYYGKEESMKKDGWTFDENGDAHSSDGGCHIASSIFKSPQHSFTVAEIEWNNAHDEFDIRSIGMRAFELSEKDYADFKKVLNAICDRIYEH